jgi:Mg2+ and Co2+ transporter CorA
MAQDTVDLSFLARLGQKTNDELKMLKKDVGEIRSLCLQSYDYMKRVERRSSELRDDLEITIKMELGGGIAHLQTGLKSGLRRIEDKLDELSQRLSAREEKS